jgi:hypothetical protein
VQVAQELFETCRHLIGFSRESGALELIHLLGGVLDSRNRPRFFELLHRWDSESRLKRSVEQEVAYLLKEIERCGGVEGLRPPRNEATLLEKIQALAAERSREPSVNGTAVEFDFDPDFYGRYLVVRDLLSSLGLNDAVPKLSPSLEQRAIKSAAFSDRMGKTEISPMVVLDDLLGRFRLEQSQKTPEVGVHKNNHAKAWRLIRYLLASAGSVDEFGELYHRLEPYLELLGFEVEKNKRPR